VLTERTKERSEPAQPQIYRAVFPDRAYFMASELLFVATSADDVDEAVRLIVEDNADVNVQYAHSHPKCMSCIAA
jgi:hypothetical protein